MENFAVKIPAWRRRPSADSGASAFGVLGSETGRSHQIRDAATRPPGPCHTQREGVPRQVARRQVGRRGRGFDDPDGWTAAPAGPATGPAAVPTIPAAAAGAAAVRAVAAGPALSADATAAARRSVTALAAIGCGDFVIRDGDVRAGSSQYDSK
jgi:hypothetical protein